MPGSVPKTVSFLLSLNHSVCFYGKKSLVMFVSHYFPFYPRLPFHSSIKQSLFRHISNTSGAGLLWLLKCHAPSYLNLICQTWLHLNKNPPEAQTFCLVVFRLALNTDIHSDKATTACQGDPNYWFRWHKEKLLSSTASVHLFTVMLYESLDIECL